MAPTSHQARNARIRSASTGRQPKARVARYLKSREPTIVEGAKNALLLKGIRCSNRMATVLKDLRAMKAPNAKLLSKNNQIAPFEDASSLEFLTTKNDCSLFALASHNKKRPNNLVLGRTFDRQILDIAELGIVRYKSLDEYRGAPKKRVGSCRPLMLFAGDAWHLDSDMGRLRNLLVDFFRGEPVQKLALSGIDHLMSFTAVAAREGGGAGGLTSSATVHLRTYYVKLKKDPAGGSAPLPHLTPSGPDMDFRVRRTQYAAPDLWKAAMKQPKAAANKPKKIKNKSTNVFGETIGRLHLERQDLDRVQGRRSKAIRVAGKIEAEEERAAVEAELGREEEEMDMEFRQTYGFAEKDMEGISGGRRQKR